MKVLQVVTDTARRGGQVFGTDLHAALTARGHDVRTVALSTSTHPNPLPLAALGHRRLGPPTLRALRKCMREADVAVAHGSTTLPACAIGGLGQVTPFVYRNIGDPLYWASSAARRARVRMFLSRAARVAALWPGSAHALRQRLGVPGAKLAIIPNGVPADRCPVPTGADREQARGRFGLRRDGPVAVYIGALTGEKDLGMAIRAVAALETVQLLVVGDGPNRRRLEFEAARSAPGRIRFAGPTEGSTDALAAADVVVLPSRSEGMPGVLIEAGMTGLPGVATAVGAVEEIVSDGVTGATARVGDQGAFTAGLAAALLNARTWGDAARRHCLARFEINPVADAWEDLLLAVVDQHRTYNPNQRRNRS